MKHNRDFRLPEDDDDAEPCEHLWWTMAEDAVVCMDCGTDYRVAKAVKKARDDLDRYEAARRRAGL